MLGSLKKLFFKDTGEDLANSIPEPAVIAPRIERVETPSPLAAAPPAPETAQPAATPSAALPASELLSLPLPPILSRLPNSIATVVQSQGSGFVSLPIARILQELPKGSVKIPFGDIRLAAPAGVFFDNPRHDQVLVELPLDEILSRLPKTRLTRRPDQKQIKIAAEITDVFGPHGEGLSVSTAPVNAPKTTGFSSGDTTLAGRNDTSISRRDTSTTRRPDTSMSRRTDTNMFMRNAPAVAPTPAAHTSPTAVVAPARPAGSTEQFTKIGEPIVVPLTLISEGWPELVQVEIREANLANKAVSIPMERLAEPLRAGKVVFTWKQICAWMNPPTEIESAAQDLPLELPLKVIAPLFMAKHRKAQPQKKVTVAEIPDLFAAKPGATEAPKSEPATPSAPAVQQISPIAPASAPSVPAAKPAPAPSVPSAPAAPSTPPTSPIVPSAPIVSSVALPKMESKPSNITSLKMPEAKPAAAPAPVAAAKPSLPAGNSIAEIFGQPTKTDWPPADVLKHLVKLPGVTGAFLAMSDGLLVAAELPPPWKAETVAAFLPQIFGRMNQYTRELQIGGLSCLTFVAEKSAWQIVKSGGIYLVTLSKAGENLPQSILNTIATELGKQIQ